MPFKSSREAIARAERDAGRCAGVVAVQTTIDTESGEILDEPIILASFGELPADFAG